MKYFCCETPQADRHSLNNFDFDDSGAWIHLLHPTLFAIVGRRGRQTAS